MASTRLIKQFIVLAEELHFGRAADRLHMSQPPLSQAIIRLEEELGVELLDRTTRSVALTEAGRIFLAEAQRLMEQHALLIQHTRQAHSGTRGTLVLGFVGSVSYGLLPKLLIDSRRVHPEVAFDLSEMPSLDQLRAFEARRLDMGLIRLPLTGAGDLALKVVQRERMIAVLPKSHPLASLRRLPLARLADEIFVMFSPDRVLSLHAKTMMACHAAGFSPRVGPEAWQMPTMVSLVAANAGVALLPAQVRTIAHREVVYREVTGDDRHLDLEIALAWRRDNRSELCRRVVETIHEVAKR